MNYGSKVWLIPDCYYPSKSVESKSHDAVCVLNTSKLDAHIKITLYFEDSPKNDSYISSCPAERTHHIRLDKIISLDNKHIPTDTPYAIMIESDTEIIVQYSRLDTSLGGMALMTTIAYPVK